MPKEAEVSLIRLKQLENKFSILQERMEILEEEFENLSQEVMETRSAKDKTTSIKEIIEVEQGKEIIIIVFFLVS